MEKKKLDYQALEAKTTELQQVVDALRREDVDAVVGERHILLLRLKEAEEQLNKHQEQMEALIKERTLELQVTNDMLRKELQKREEAEQRLFEYQKKLQQLTSELLLVEERERRRIAMELHDSAVQSVALSIMTIARLIKDPKSTPVVQPLQELHKQLQQVAQELRSLIFDISPPVLYNIGFGAAIEELTRQMSKRHNIKISFHNNGGQKPLGPDISIFLYQIVRELLVNVVKHSHAENAEVSLNRPDSVLEVTVQDNGIGFDTGMLTGTSKTSGFGLFSIRERLNQIDGKMIAESSSSGTRITIITPLKQDVNPKE